MGVFIVSRGLQRSLTRNVAAIVNGHFNEVQIKELLIDAREAAKAIRGKDDRDHPIAGPLAEVQEVANFIAHDHIDRGGAIDRVVRDHVATIHRLLNEGVDFNPFQFPVERALNANRVVLGLVGTVTFILSKTQASLTDKHRTAFHERQNEIALCILLLLQDKRITLRNDSGNAMLYVRAYEGFYRLYCQVHDTIIERESRKRVGVEAGPPIYINFPVMSSGAKDHDALAFDENAILPPFLEGYRDDTGRLRVQIAL